MTPQSLRDLTQKLMRETPLHVLAMEHEVMPLLIDLWEVAKDLRMQDWVTDESTFNRLHAVLSALAAFKEGT